MSQETGYQQLVTKNSIERASRDTFKRFLDNEYQAEIEEIKGQEVYQAQLKVMLQHYTTAMEKKVEAAEKQQKIEELAFAIENKRRNEIEQLQAEEVAKASNNTMIEEMTRIVTLLGCTDAVIEYHNAVELLDAVCDEVFNHIADGVDSEKLDDLKDDIKHNMHCLSHPFHLLQMQVEVGNSYHEMDDDTKKTFKDQAINVHKLDPDCGEDEIIRCCVKRSCENAFQKDLKIELDKHGLTLPREIDPLLDSFSATLERVMDKLPQLMENKKVNSAVNWFVEKSRPRWASTDSYKKAAALLNDLSDQVDDKKTPQVDGP